MLEPSSSNLKSQLSNYCATYELEQKNEKGIFRQNKKYDGTELQITLWINSNENYKNWSNSLMDND